MLIFRGVDHPDRSKSLPQHHLGILHVQKKTLRWVVHPITISSRNHPSTDFQRFKEFRFPRKFTILIVFQDHHGKIVTKYCWCFRNPSWRSPVEVGSLSHYLRRVLAPSEVIVWDFFHQQNHPKLEMFVFPRILLSSKTMRMACKDWTSPCILGPEKVCWNMATKWAPKTNQL